MHGSGDNDLELLGYLTRLATLLGLPDSEPASWALSNDKRQRRFLLVPGKRALLGLLDSALRRRRATRLLRELNW